MISNVFAFVSSALLLVCYLGNTQKLVNEFCAQKGNIPVCKDGNSNLELDLNDVKSALIKIHLSRIALIYLMIGFFLPIMKYCDLKK